MTCHVVPVGTTCWFRPLVTRCSPFLAWRYRSQRQRQRSSASVGSVPHREHVERSRGISATIGSFGASASGRPRQVVGVRGGDPAARDRSRSSPSRRRAQRRTRGSDENRVGCTCGCTRVGRGQRPAESSERIEERGECGIFFHSIRHARPPSRCRTLRAAVAVVSLRFATSRSAMRRSPGRRGGRRRCAHWSKLTSRQLRQEGKCRNDQGCLDHQRTQDGPH